MNAIRRDYQASGVDHIKGKFARYGRSPAPSRVHLQSWRQAGRPYVPARPRQALAVMTGMIGALSVRPQVDRSD
ncbi:MAG: hypothetical protein AVDCRST_MAG93-3854 [uncultured Chloroflexia bacterium]|uniref:Uncharacterized protein n=1 Tax=uncultured Chloroflexia bacterium TaxID=1672391 RepID=A0A6J4JXM5_9CHLR|nr:MAG: hypothetical protein AVDCRST_MAG93-3854 [uncultured Chloroflexia bacterium]